MGFFFFIGCLTIAFSPCLASFTFGVARQPQFIILFVVSCFFWLISSLITALFWFLTGKASLMIVIPIGVLIQEFLRYSFFKLYVKSEKFFHTKGVAFPFADLGASLSFGTAFGFCQVIFMYGSLLGYSYGPGTFYLTSCSDISIFIIGALSSFANSILHIFLGILGFDAFRRRSIFRITLVITLHLLSTFIGYINSNNQGCVIAIPMLFLNASISIVATLVIIRQSDYNSKLGIRVL